MIKKEETKRKKRNPLTQVEDIQLHSNVA